MTPSLLAHGDPELVWVAAVFLLWLGVVALGVIQVFICLFTKDGWQGNFRRGVAAANVCITGIVALLAHRSNDLDNPEILTLGAASLVTAAILALPRA